jgi:hypothetical protein
MKNKTIFSGIVLVIGISLLIVAISFGSFYTYWNSASPDKTCASCHEIGSAVHSLSQSGHRELHCKECHGTALSNGFHSLKEKAMMVVNHVREERVEDIRMSEAQLLDVMKNCKRCHASEFANWESGGHSATYNDIFLNETHNKTEQLNFDCLRCHGMFYEGTTSDLVAPINTQGPWNLKKQEKGNQPVIPCMACHQVHTDGDIAKNPNYSKPASVFYQRSSSVSKLSFYDRHEKVHVRSDRLPKLKLYEGERQVVVSDDHLMRNCTQCHAPNGRHEAGTSDDRTPRGVHQGLSCISCHEPHSNNARNSCIKCHPAISNCKLDVTTMNTTFANPQSPNNIHWVSCNNCHNDQIKPGAGLIGHKRKNFASE